MSKGVPCPFGMQIQSRSYTAPDKGYRFGFNGMEGENGVRFESTWINYGGRIYNPGISRWLSVDKLGGKYPFASPYGFVANKPILSRDFNGDDHIIMIYKQGQNNSGHVSIAVADYRSVNVNGEMVKQATGTYTVYSASAIATNELEAFVKDPTRVVAGKVETLTGRTEESLALVPSGDQKSPDAIIKRTSTSEQDEYVKTWLDSKVTKFEPPTGSSGDISELNDPHNYKNKLNYSLTKGLMSNGQEAYSCSRFVAKALVKYDKLIQGDDYVKHSSLALFEHIKYNGKTILSSSGRLTVPSFNQYVVTPSSLFRHYSKDANSTVVKDKFKETPKTWETPYIDVVSGSQIKDLDPSK